MSFKLLIILFTLFTAVYGRAETICYITIGSDNEKNLFIKKFPESQHIELTEFQSQGKHHWFQEACKQPIRCNKLIVSGHFAGRFWGKSELHLKLEELEAASCNRTCDGILGASEVYLLGCNTLANKKPDYRSPEEYFAALRSQGFTISDASEVVASRYLPVGGSIDDRMSTTFSINPESDILGFSSVGPSGPNIEPKLKEFLDKYNSSEIHENWHQSMSYTYRSSIKSSRQADEVTCNFINKKTDFDLAKHILKVSESSSTLNYFFHIKNSIDYLVRKKLSYETDMLLLEIKQNSSLKEKTLSVIPQLEPIPYYQVEFLNFAKTMGWISNFEVQNYFKKIISKTLSQELSYNSIHTLCLMKTNIALEVSDISKISPSRIESLIQILNCLGPQSNTVVNFVLDELKKKNHIFDLRFQENSVYKSLMSLIHNSKVSSQNALYFIIEGLEFKDSQSLAAVNLTFQKNVNSNLIEKLQTSINTICKNRLIQQPNSNSLFITNQPLNQSYFSEAESQISNFVRNEILNKDHFPELKHSFTELKNNYPTCLATSF